MNVPTGRPSSPFSLLRPKIPFLADYWVLVHRSSDPTVSMASLLAAAETFARRAARARFGDPECFTLLCNARRTRRKDWPHVHIILAPNVRAKRRALFWLFVKHVSRPWRWPGLRYLRRGSR